MVDIRDIAAVVIRTLTEPGHEGKTYVITGAEALTFTDVAAKLAERRHHPGLAVVQSLRFCERLPSASETERTRPESLLRQESGFVLAAEVLDIKSLWT